MDKIGKYIMESVDIKAMRAMDNQPLNDTMAKLKQVLSNKAKAMD